MQIQIQIWKGVIPSLRTREEYVQVHVLCPIHSSGNIYIYGGSMADL